MLLPVVDIHKPEGDLKRLVRHVARALSNDAEKLHRRRRHCLTRHPFWGAAHTSVTTLKWLGRFHDFLQYALQLVVRVYLALDNLRFLWLSTDSRSAQVKTFLERFRSYDDDTLIGVSEAAEVIGTTAHALYRRLQDEAKRSANLGDRRLGFGVPPTMPRPKPRSQILFHVGELRAWVRSQCSTPLATDVLASPSIETRSPPAVRTGRPRRPVAGILST